MDIPENQIIQFRFEAPKVIEEAEKEAVHGYETDEEEFMIRAEVKERDEITTAGGDCYGPLPQLQCQDGRGGREEGRPEDPA